MIDPKHWRESRFMLGEDGEPYFEPDILKHAQWFDKADRKVARDDVGGKSVSTVFLGINHNHRRSGPPVLWETLIFPTDENERMERYTSKEDALIGHREMVDELICEKDLEERKAVIADSRDTILMLIRAVCEAPSDPETRYALADACEEEGMMEQADYHRSYGDWLRERAGEGKK